MKCPVCKTECGNAAACPECGFEELNPTFLSKEEGEAWIENVVWPWRYQYWETLDEFEIKGTTLTKYYDSCAKTGDVRVPYGISSIGERAFHGCKYLFEVTLPASVKRVGLEAFSACPNLDFIEIPFGVEVIEKRAFDCELQDLLIPASVKQIDEFFCTYVEHISLDLRNAKYTIQNNCIIEKSSGLLLMVCDKEISNVEIPYGIQRIGSGAFLCCENLKEVVVPDGVDSIGDSTFEGCSSLEKITLPNSIREIGSNTFANCRLLCELYLPKCLETIGYRAFRGTSVKELFLPSGIMRIGHNFAPDVEKFCVQSNDYYLVKNNVLIYRKFNSLVTICDKSVSDVDVPPEIKEINGGAFERCSFIRKVAIPSGVTYIGESAFQFCRRLSDVEFSSNLQCIGKSAFYSCCSLKKINLPENVREIEAHAFCSCDSVENIILPQSIESVEEYAFSSCKNLKTVVLPDGFYNLGRGIFLECWNLDAIFCESEVPEESSWDNEWNLRSAIYADDFFPVYYKGTWHYENGKPIPND